MEGRKKWPECEIMGSRARGRDNDQRETARTKWERLFWLRSRAAASGEAPVSKRSAKKFAALSLTRTRMHTRTSTHMILNTVPPCWQPLLVFQASCALRPALERRFRSIQAAELHAFLN